jgi:hypothetical protein
MIRSAVSATLLALALSACAKVGTLDRPAPLFGARAKADYQAQKAAAAAAARAKPNTGPEPLPPTPDSLTPPP